MYRVTRSRRYLIIVWRSPCAHRRITLRPLVFLPRFHDVYKRDTRPNSDRRIGQRRRMKNVNEPTAWDDRNS